MSLIEGELPDPITARGEVYTFGHRRRPDSRYAGGEGEAMMVAIVKPA